MQLSTAYPTPATAQVLCGRKLPFRMTTQGKMKTAQAGGVTETARENRLTEALQARLLAFEEEIVRLTELASGTKDPDQQQQYWDLAQELQREARDIRAEIHSRGQSAER